jgi:signal transduction histidine kinase
MQMSVRRQILLAQILPLLPMALVGIVTVFALFQMGFTAREVRTLGMERIDKTDRAIEIFREEVVLLDRPGWEDEAGVRDAALERSRELHEIVEELEDGTGIGVNLSKKLDAYEETVGLSEGQRDGRDSNVLAKEFHDSLFDVKALFRYKVETGMSEVSRSGRNTSVGVVLAVGFLLLVSVVAGRLLTRRLLESLELIEMGTDQLAQGHFDARIRLGGNDEFGRLARAFNRMADRIGALDRMKVDFFANISHDLKTPLTSMVEAVELLDEEIAGPLTSDQKRLVRVARESALRLKALVSNVLDVSRMGAREVARTRGDVLAVVESTLKELELLAVRKSISLERTGHDKVPEVLVNRGMLEQVMMNLVGNAIRYSPSEGRIVVHVAVDDSGIQGAPMNVRVEVSDEGPGIPEEWRQRVFQRFTQVPKDGDQTGTGLGLYISRQIVESHDGEIGVGLSNGGGCKLWFTLPLADGC